MTDSTSAFLEYVRLGQYNSARGLVEDKAKISFSNKDEKGNNVVHTIALNCKNSPSSACSKLLCAIAKENASLFNEKNLEGNTPALIAVGNDNMIELLKYCGADLSIPNKDGKSIVAKSVSPAPSSAPAPQRQEPDLIGSLESLGEDAFNTVKRTIDDFTGTEQPSFKKRLEPLTSTVSNTLSKASVSAESFIKQNEPKVKQTIEQGLAKGQDFIKNTQPKAEELFNKGLATGQELFQKGQPKAQEAFKNLQDSVRQSEQRFSTGAKQLLEDFNKGTKQVVSDVKKATGQEGGAVGNESTEFLKRLRTLMDSESQTGGGTVNFSHEGKKKTTGWRQMHYTLDSVNEAELTLDRPFDPEAEKLHNDASQKLLDYGVSQDDVKLYKAIFWQKAKKDAEKLKDQGQRVDNLQKSQMLVDLITKEAVKGVKPKELTEMKKIFEQRAKEKEERGSTDKPKKEKGPKKAAKGKKSKKDSE